MSEEIRTFLRVSMSWSVMAIFIVIVFTAGSSLIKELNKIDNLETRVGLLEHRVGVLCVDAYNKSTGFDKAMVGGNKK